MSVWTHVNAGIRFDGMPQVSDKFRPDLGKTFTYESPEADWDACNVPFGSEGSLQYNVVQYSTGLPWLAVHIWGDLRGYENVDEIVAYLHRIVKDKLIRDGIAQIEVEYREPVCLRYDTDMKRWRPLLVPVATETPSEERTTAQANQTRRGNPADPGGNSNTDSGGEGNSVAGEGGMKEQMK